MFDNIIGQDKVIDLLKSDILNKTLPNSMIFYGESSTGKLTSALELFRVLNCLENKDFNCSCINCKSVNDLNFEGLIFLSRRNFTNLLKETINSYNKFKEKKYFNNIIKIIKLVSLPLQDYLVKDNFTENEKNLFYGLLEKLSNFLYNEEFSNSELEIIINTIEKISDSYKKLNIPVDIIRAMLDWTYIAQPDINRVVIIDHLDYFEKSSQNILLKRLEEPSSNLFFILIAENKNNILKTITSRCRSYYFQKISEENVKLIIKNNFGETGDFKTIKNFLLHNDEDSSLNIFPIIIKLLNLVFSKEAPFAELNIFLSAYNNRKFVKLILNELGILLQKEISRRELGLTEESDLKMLKKLSNLDLNLINSMIMEKYKIIDKYGLNSILLLEGIFYPLKAMVQNDQI